MRVTRFVRQRLGGPVLPIPIGDYYRRMVWLATTAAWFGVSLVAGSELVGGIDPDHAKLELALVAGATAIGLAAYVLPWSTLIARRGVAQVSYAWSLTLFAFAGVYVLVDTQADLYLLYFPALLFVVATLDGRGQLIMTVVGMLSYALPAVYTSGSLSRDLILRLAAFGLVAVVGSYITREQRETALENARLYDETRRAGEHLRQVFSRFGKTFSSSLDLDNILQLITDVAVDMVGTDAAMLVLLDHQGMISDLGASSGPRQRSLRRMQHSAREWLFTNIIRGRAAVQIADVAADERFVPSEPAAQLGSVEPAQDLGSYLGVPLLLRGRVVGLLAVGRVRPGPYAEAEIDLVSSFANQAAVAIENARLFTTLQERLRELSGLHSISLAFSSLTTLEDTYGQLVERISRLLDVERCVIMLPDEQGRNLVAQAPAFGLSAEQVRTMRVPIEDRSAGGRVWLTGRAYLTNDAQSDPRNMHHFARAFGDRSLLLVPLRVEGKTVGLLRASNKRHDRFTNNDVRLLTIFANQAAVVVRNAVLYREAAYERARLKAIFDHASDGIMIIDQNCTIVAFNPAMEVLTGWQASEAIGRGCDEVCPTLHSNGQSFSDLTCPKSHVLDPRQPGRYLEMRILARGDRARDIGVSHALLQASEGEIFGVSIVRDISKTKELERVKSQFISTVSHELRTPLASMKTSIGLLLGNLPESMPEPLVRLMHNIERSSRRLENLVADLLDLARLESGRVRLISRPVDLRDVVNSAAATIRPLLEEKAQQLFLRMPGEPCRTVADRQRLEQVLLNLLSNANKYTAQGGEIVMALAPCDRRSGIQARGLEASLAGGMNANSRLSTGEARSEPPSVAGPGCLESSADGCRQACGDSTGDGTFWCVSVADTGSGIPVEDRELIFERFYRSGDEDTQRTVGTGLGLPIAKALIELHHGKIWLESRPGQGSKFYFLLPMEGINEDIGD